MIKTLLLLFIVIAAITPTAAQRFVTADGGALRSNGRPYYFVGTNYWYGSLLGLEKDKRRGVLRLRKELDFLKKQGVTNLRLMAGAEGSGTLNGVPRVGPPLQPELGRFDEKVLDGLDVVLAEMSKRDMKAVIFLSNNWEWSGGFQQYLIWSGLASPELLTEKPSWEDLQYWVARFYVCELCHAAYLTQMRLVVSRTNKLNRRKYADDPTIMAWEIANEPRPMRPAANELYANWIRQTAAAIKKQDKNHLLTIGLEGSIGTQSIDLFERVHRDPNVDYLTIHIWPKNWGWLADGSYLKKTTDYIHAHIAVAKRLKKPLVIEEFGLPRDGSYFDPKSTTAMRDVYYQRIFSYLGGNVAGANFWAFGGTARPVKGQVFWKTGDEYMGDPPMEEQGLNTVFDSDRSTWNAIRTASARVRGFR